VDQIKLKEFGVVKNTFRPGWRTYSLLRATLSVTAEKTGRTTI